MRAACATKRIFLPLESISVKWRCGIQQRQRQARKAGTGADIRDAAARQIGCALRLSSRWRVSIAPRSVMAVRL